MTQKRIKKPRGKARYLDGKCIACGDRCQASCPVDCIEMNEDGTPTILLAKCIGCQKCVKVCPSDAIEMYYTPDEEIILAEYMRQQGDTPDVEEEVKTDSPWKNVWVFIEQAEGVVHTVSWELLGAGRTLANDLGVQLCAFVIGSGVKDTIAKEAFGHGAEKVYVIDDPVLKHYRTQSYLKAAVKLIEKYKPEIVLMGATGLGRDLAGAVATKLQTGLTADCTGLTISKSDRLLEQTRPAFGGNIMATILCETHRPQMASVRPRVMNKLEFMPDATGEIIEEPLDVSEESVISKIIEIIQMKTDGNVNLPGADIIVSGGKGMMGVENFKMLEELAALLGGVVGCSRSVVDATWLDRSHQVGQTGTTVKPKLYIACGISGAIQHLVGMQTSEFIIAINKDKTAPIFDVAHLGIVGDVFDIIPPVIEKIKQIKQEQDSNVPAAV